MTRKQWNTKCPVCGSRNVQHQEGTIRYCDDCRFQWSMKLTQVLLAQLAIAHNNGR